MDVTFEGGPFDGQTHPVGPEPTMHAVIYWPPDADPDVDRTDIPGHEGLVEYIYEGSGKAVYVAGVVPPDEGQPAGPLSEEKSGATSEPGRPQPSAAEVESARLLEADAADRMAGEGVDRDTLRRLADEFIALDLGTGTQEFVEWARTRLHVPD